MKTSLEYGLSNGPNLKVLSYWESIEISKNVKNAFLKLLIMKFFQIQNFEWQSC